MLDAKVARVGRTKVVSMQAEHMQLSCVLVLRPAHGTLRTKVVMLKSVSSHETSNTQREAA